MNISAQEYQEIFNHGADAKLLLLADAPHYTILDVNLAYLATTASKREDLIGKPVFAAFPISPNDEEAKNIERSIHSFETVIETRKPHIIKNYGYDIPAPGHKPFYERYWTTINTPILDETGGVKLLVHSPKDVTEHMLLQQREKDGIEALKMQRKQLHAIFMQAPVGIGIFKGPDYIVDLINPSLAEIYGMSGAEMLGKPVFDTLPSAKDQGFERLLDEVRETGKSYHGKGIEIPLIRQGLLEKVYVDFAYVPLYNEDGSITAIIAVATEVTAQVDSMHQLEEAEERARLAADAVALGTYDLNLLNGEMVTSERFAHIFGFDTTVPREVYAEAIHPEDRIIRKIAHEEAMEKGIMMYEVRIRHADESIRWIKVEGRVLYDKAGNPQRILGTLLDISSQKWEKELREKLITLVDHSVDLMCVLDLNGLNTYINAAGNSLLGYGSEEAISLSISTMHPAEDLAFLRETIWPAVLENGDWAGNLHLKNEQTGEVIPVFNHYIRIDDHITAEPIAIGVVMRDLRQELLAKQALADSEQLLRNITSASPTALWMTDAKGYITYVNQTWVEWSGKSFKENLGEGWLTMITPEDQKLVAERFRESVEQRLHYEVEFRIPKLYGEQRWCVALGQPQYNAQGEFTGFIGSCTDITEHKELQTQKDNFIGIASHELKTPVTSLKGYAQVLERVLKKKGHELEAGMMQKMDAQLNRLTSLIRDLLDVTKVNSGKLAWNEEEFELRPVIESLVEDLQRTTQKHSLLLQLDTNARVYADKDRIEQVVINLISNAIKYSPDNEQIIVHCHQNAQEIIFCVEDFGVGISKENQRQVFDQFFRVSGEMQHTFPGMGLGLFISAEIIKRAGGKIWVESEEGQGSRFYFSLPLNP